MKIIFALIFVLFTVSAHACLPTPFIHELKEDIYVKIDTRTAGAGIIFKGESSPPKLIETLDSEKNRVSWLIEEHGYKPLGGADYEANWTRLTLKSGKNVTYTFPFTLIAKIKSEEKEYTVMIEFYEPKAFKRGMQMKGGCGSASVKPLKKAK